MAYSDTIVSAVWEQHARAVPDQDRDEWRKDECGAWINRRHYGNTESEFGWKIENVSPGGTDTPDNLRPYHHENGYDVPGRKAHCLVSADAGGVANKKG
jgi:hypothetical protein